MRGWWEERLDLRRFRRKYLRKTFPVHSSFFLGEIALFAFITLVITGFFLTVNFVPSTQPEQIAGKGVPAAYASVLRIDTLPFGRVIRSTHHWSAHILIAAAFLHLLRHLLTGAYKKPREVNWWIGLALLVFAVVTAFSGYSLPHDAFAVVATKIGYGIAASLPWIGGWLAEVLFGGVYPTIHSLPRLYAAHILLMPLLILATLAVHLLLVIKQLHTQPRAAEKVAPGRILGVPMVPGQALLMTTLFLLYLSVVVITAGMVDVHPVTAFGPPTTTTPNVRPDWYFLWVYGVLQLIPSSWHFTLFGGSFSPEFWGGVVLPGLLVLGAVVLPLLDRSPRRLRYLELPSEHPLRTGLTMGMVAFFVVASVAGFHDTLGVPVWAFQAGIVVIPAAVAALTALLVPRFARR